MNDWNVIEDVSKFRETFRNSKYVVALTGAGISAESGIPTFRGKGAYWRGYAVQTLAAMSKFKESPSLVWEFYHYRREIVLTKEPNAVSTVILLLIPFKVAFKLLNLQDSHFI